MSKFTKIALVLALVILCASPVLALDAVFDPLADLYSELEEKADPSAAVEPEVTTTETAEKITTGDYLSELQKMADRMKTAGYDEIPAVATTPETVAPAAENNSIDAPTGVQISQSGGAIEDAASPSAGNSGSVATTGTTTPLVAGNVDSQVFVFAYDGSAATHSSAEKLTAAGPAAIALVTLAGGLVGAYFLRRKIFNV
jgi:hypothetical protein